MYSLKRLINSKNTKAGGFYLIGNIFNSGISFLTVPIFTRLMSTSDYGIVNIYMSWVSILSLIVGLSLGNSIRNAYVEFKEDLEGYISSIFFLSLLNFIASSVIIILFSYFFVKQIDLLLVILCLVQSFTTFVINSILIKYMMSVEYFKRTLLLAVPNIIVILLSVIFLVKMDHNKFLGRIIPYIFVYSLISLYFLVMYFIKGKKFINLKYWKYAILLSVPLIFHGLSVNVLSTSDRTLITMFHGASEAGVYSLIYNFSMITMVIATSLESVWIPWFNQKLKNGERYTINRNVKLYIEILVVLMILILLISPEILVIMAPKSYWSGKILIPPVLLASFFIFLYSISVDLEYYYKSTKVIATNTIIAATINLGLNFILVPYYGAIAAAFTTVVAYAISFGIHYRAARKLDNILFPFRIYIKPILIMVLFTVITYLLMDYFIIRWLIAIVGIVFYIAISLRNERYNDFFNRQQSEAKDNE